MPSINRRGALAISFRRAEVTAFWMLATAMLAAAAALGAYAAGARAYLLWAAAAILAPAPGLLWPPWFVFGVRAWNKGAHLVASALNAYVLRVCYYVLVGSVSVTGSPVRRQRAAPASSRWLPHPAPQPAFDDEWAAEGGWRGALLASARRPEAAWILALIPVVLLLRILGDDQTAASPSSSTYTLY
jgi:hypothetical protein